MPLGLLWLSIDQPRTLVISKVFLVQLGMALYFCSSPHPPFAFPAFFLQGAACYAPHYHTGRRQRCRCWGCTQILGAFYRPFLTQYSVRCTPYPPHLVPRFSIVYSLAYCVENGQGQDSHCLRSATLHRVDLHVLFLSASRRRRSTLTCLDCLFFDFFVYFFSRLFSSVSAFVHLLLHPLPA